MRPHVYRPGIDTRLMGAFLILCAAVSLFGAFTIFKFDRPGPSACAGGIGLGAGGLWLARFGLGLMIGRLVVDDRGFRVRPPGLGLALRWDEVEHWRVEEFGEDGCLFRIAIRARGRWPPRQIPGAFAFRRELLGEKVPGFPLLVEDFIRFAPDRGLARVVTTRKEGHRDIDAIEHLLVGLKMKSAGEKADARPGPVADPMWDRQFDAPGPIA